jgi:hypothetical protein
MEALEEEESEEESDASSVGNDSPEAYTNAVVSTSSAVHPDAIVSYSSKVENVHETSLILSTIAHSIGKIPSTHFMTLRLLFYSVIGANNLSDIITDMLVLSPRRAWELELGAYDLNFAIDNVLVNFNLNYHDDDDDDDDDDDLLV